MLQDGRGRCETIRACHCAASRRARCASPLIQPSPLPAQAAKVFNKSILRKSKNWRKVGGKMVFDTALTEVEREIALMKKIRHPRIVKLYEVVDDPEQGKLYMCTSMRSSVGPLPYFRG